MKNIFKTTVLIASISFMAQCKKDTAINEPIKFENLIDIDGNTYNAVKIGSQIWRAHIGCTINTKNMFAGYYSMV